MGNDIRENKHFKRVNKKRAFQKGHFVKSHIRELNLLKELEDLLFAVEAGELTDTVLCATTGRTSDVMHEVFYQERMKNNRSEEKSI